MHNSTTTPWVPVTDFDRLIVLEVIMDANKCTDVRCADWRSQHCICRIEFEEINNGL